MKKSSLICYCCILFLAVACNHKEKETKDSTQKKILVAEKLSVTSFYFERSALKTAAAGSGKERIFFSLKYNSNDTLDVAGWIKHTKNGNSDFNETADLNCKLIGSKLAIPNGVLLSSFRIKQKDVETLLSKANNKFNYIIMVPEINGNLIIWSVALVKELPPPSFNKDDLEYQDMKGNPIPPGNIDLDLE
ncbi:MAG TPA: hypothetical protein VLC98_12795 [Phnomibacter sp.]|nr:hypothetical protein [Phnomibacter sp.]